MHDLVSVIIPIYNTKEYLRACFESVVKQSYRALEIILVDDGSDIETADMCDSLAATDVRVKVFHQKNGGLSSARNAGLEMASGEYIFFLDSDDYIHHDIIWKLYNALCSHNADLAVCDYMRVSAIGENAQKPVDCDSSAKEIIYNDTELFDKIYSSEYVKYIVCWNKLYKRELLLDTRFPLDRIHEDESFTPRVLQKVQKVQKAVYLDEKLYYYVSREGSLSKSGLEKSSKHKLECMKENALYFREGDMEYAYGKESIRYMRGIIYFSNQFLKGKTANKERIKALHEEFVKFYGMYDGPEFDRFHKINFWLFRNVHGVYISVFAVIRNVLRK